METKGSFIRWQGRTIEELGKTINLILSLCLATVGFVVAKLLDKKFEFHFCLSKTFIIVGTLFILASIILTLTLIYNRLIAFRTTTQIARKREKNNRAGIEDLRTEVKQKDKCTWKLFRLSIISFLLGELFIIIGFIIELVNK